MHTSELQILEPNQEKKSTRKWFYRLTILGILVFLPVAYFYYHSKAFHMIDRKEWGAVEPVKKEFLSLPVENVVIDENPFSCDTKETCMSYLQELQRYRIESKIFADIDSNFYIGGNGLIYEGSGWHINPLQPEVFDQKVSYIVICVFGKLKKIETLQRQFDAIQGLMLEGVRLGNLKPDYHLFGRHQINKIETSDSQLYNLIQKSERFSTDLGLLYPKYEKQIKL